MKKLALMLVLILSNFAGNAAIDSIGIEKKNTENYILHKVEKSEGLYAIARKYRTTATAIQDANNLTNTSLQLGQVLKVPTIQNISSTKVIATKKTVQTIEHKVKQGETLSAIARKYQITLAEIKSLNNLTDGDIKVGQTLLVKSEKATRTANPSVSVKKEVKIPVTNEAKSVPEKDNTPVITAKNYSYENSKEINETGIAGWINDKNSNPKKSIALHNTAVIGTIMKVSNPSTGKMVYVKIIGTIPNAIENENLVILLSKAAASLIDATEPKFKVNLSYASPKQ